MDKEIKKPKAILPKGFKDNVQELIDLLKDGYENNTFTVYPSSDGSGLVYYIDPETKKVFVDLGIAKRMIDTIELLKEKTEGNLTMPEKNFMENTLYNLRMSFVNSANNSPSSVENSDSEDSPSSDDSQPQQS